MTSSFTWRSALYNSQGSQHDSCPHLHLNCPTAPPEQLPAGMAHRLQPSLQLLHPLSTTPWRQPPLLMLAPPHPCLPWTTPALLPLGCVVLITARAVHASRVYAGRQGHGCKQGVGGQGGKLGVGCNVGGCSLCGCLQGLTERLYGAAIGRCALLPASLSPYVGQHLQLCAFLDATYLLSQYDVLAGHVQQQSITACKLVVSCLKLEA